MIISIASAKGGNGKTTVATNLAVSIGSDVQLLDCDVEEPNAHLFLNPVIEEKKSVFTPIPKIDEEKCTFCRKCVEYCEFNAIVVIPPAEFAEVNPTLCHSCGACSYVCPENALREEPVSIGKVEAAPQAPSPQLRSVASKLSYTPINNTGSTRMNPAITDRHGI